MICNFWFEKTSLITYEHIDGINTIVAAEIIPGIVLGMITLKNTLIGLAPRSEAASTKFLSSFNIVEYNGRITNGK